MSETFPENAAVGRAQVASASSSMIPYVSPSGTIVASRSHVTVFAERVLLPEGWGRDVSIEVDGAGTIVSVRADSAAAGAIVRAGALLPGMPNIHSHVFQYAMAGRAERRADQATSGDDFWTWRRTMYELAGGLNPDSLYDIALEAYRAMALAGYASVVEFHYLHRDPAGSWYDDRSAMARALIEAAREAGLRICLLPALYSYASPDGAPLAREQRRFQSSVDDILEISRELRDTYADNARVAVGICAHSLRAVAPDDFHALLEGSPADVPIHLHIAEQQREVEEIEAALGAHPIAWLLENFDVDARWCLVHATQATPEQLAGIAQRGAVVGLCPTTEANLGDGIFPFAAFAAAGGAFGIGSDSNVTLSPADELRFLEYGQRLQLRRRTIAASRGRSCGETLYADAAAGGGAVSGFALGAITVGKHADFVTIDEAPDPDCLDRHIFARRSLPTRLAWPIGAGARG